MKKGIIILAGVFVTVTISCNKVTQKITPKNIAVAAKHDQKISDFPIMKFSKNNHDFGTINEGAIVEHTFTFTNTGTSPLVIINAVGSCGCTVSKWPKEPIAPGASGKLIVTFNSNGKPNLQHKQLTLTTNSKEGKEILKIKAMVIPKNQNGSKK